MSYRVVHLSSFGKDAKGFKKQPLVIDGVKDKIKEIIEDPSIGGFLLNSWAGFQKVSFGTKPEIRVIYKVYPCCMPEGSENTTCIYQDEEQENCKGLIDFVFIKTREECNNLYAQNGKYSKYFRRK